MSGSSEDGVRHLQKIYYLPLVLSESKSRSSQSTHPVRRRAVNKLGCLTRVSDEEFLERKGVKSRMGQVCVDGRQG